VGTERVKAASAAPSKVIWAWNWRGEEVGTAWVSVARRVIRAVAVNVFILDEARRLNGANDLDFI
jgi:hypothetical protein